MFPSRSVRCLPFVLSLLPGAVAAAESVPHRYTVAASDDGTTLTVQAEVPGTMRLRPAHPEGVDGLRERGTCDGGLVRIIRGELLLFPSSEPCVRYTVDLTVLELEASEPGARIAEAAGRWLWRAPEAPEAGTDVVLTLPEGLELDGPLMQAEGVRLSVVRAN